MEKELIVQKAYNSLSENDKQALQIVYVLCGKIEEGIMIPLRSLCDIMEVDEKVFWKEIKALTKAEFLFLQVESMFPPIEIATLLDNVSIPVDRLNGCISRLCKKTMLSLEDDLLRVRPYFSMALSTIKFVLDHPNDIHFEDFGKLLVNISRHYNIFAKPDHSIHEVHDLPLWRGIVLAKSKIDDKNMLYATLCISQGTLLLNGYWYNESRDLLDQALSIMHGNSNTLAWCYFVNALWWENYGVMGRCLEFAYKSWEIADESLKDHVAVYIGYQLALLQEHAASDEWVNKLDIKKYPEHHAVWVYYYLTLALKCNDEALVEDNLMRAECLLNQMNHQAPLKARVFYVRHQIYYKWGLSREACEQYRLYVNSLGVHYKSTEGAVCIYAGAEVNRLTAMGALIAAKHVTHNTLDFINLSSEYALSVKTDICLSYLHFYLTSKLYSLADVYYSIGKEIIEQIIPPDDTIDVLRNIFEEIPASVSGDSILWLFEYYHLQTMMTNRSPVEVKTQIDLLMKRFPSHQDELQIIAGSLLDSYDMIHTFHMAISTSEHSKRFEIALQCARIAVSQGLSWDGMDFYDIVLNTDGYKALTKFSKIDILLEVVQTIEQCGERRRAWVIWTELEALARGTSKLADVYQAHGNCSYDFEEYYEALEYFEKCLAIVRPEEGIIDQRLSSVWAYKSSCYGALGEYQFAYDSAVKAKQYFPLEEFDAFSLEFNHGFFAICVKKYEEARHILTRAKKLARTKDERESVDEQLSILAMKKEERGVSETDYIQF